MAQPYAKKRQSALRRDKAKLENYGAKLFHEVKRFDGDGNLIETISPDELMAQSIGSTVKKRPKDRARLNRRLSKTNGEGSQKAWAKVVAKVKKGARIPNIKVKL